MGVYGRLVLPRLIAWAMRQEVLAPYRRRVAGAASGNVLELGIGAGANLPFYGPEVRSAIGLDPSGALLAMARPLRLGAPFPVALVAAAGERLPLEGRSVDTVLTTWTLCSVADPLAVLSELRRVLKPSGRLVFVEHGRAPDPRVAAWQDRLTPLWRRVAGGCHLNRRIDVLLPAAGFALDRLHAGYMRGPRVATFMYEGCARPR